MQGIKRKYEFLHRHNKEHLATEKKTQVGAAVSIIINIKISSLSNTCNEGKVTKIFNYFKDC